MKLIIKKNRKGKWFWHIKARNGKIVCTSGEDFGSKGNAKKAALRVVRSLQSKTLIITE